MNERHPDRGFTLIEVLLVILILGLLSAVVIASVDGMRANAEGTGCVSDRYVLQVAVESFFAERTLDAIPAADGTPDGYERTLVDEGFLREVSTLHQLDMLGEITPAPGSICAD